MKKIFFLNVMAILLAACVPPEPPTPSLWYQDSDSDGYGNPDEYISATSRPTGYVSNNKDCDDTNGATNPASTESLGFDGADNNCDGSVDEGLYAIGDIGPAGGIVFFLISNQHGLEAAPADQDDGSGAELGCYNIAGADGTEIGTGMQNTFDILVWCNGTGTAEELVDAYSLNGFNDWFLPSKDELYELYKQKDVVGGFASGQYWSSSEENPDDAWYMNFDTGFPDGSANKANMLGVRAVRAF